VNKIKRSVGCIVFEVGGEKECVCVVCVKIRFISAASDVRNKFACMKKLDLRITEEKRVGICPHFKN
jgi:hypothetical protein